MKKQVKRLSPHQNAKVFALLMAVAVVPLMIPMMLMSMFGQQPLDPQGNPMPMFPGFMFILFPLFYLVFGYISVWFVCVIYNFLAKWVGGFEYEAHEVDA